LQHTLRQQAEMKAVRVRHWSRFVTRLTYPRDLPLLIGVVQHHRFEPLPADLWAKLETVAGFLSPTEAGLLYWAAREWPLAGPVVELGSFCGRSTIVFASAGRQVHAIDAWGGVAVPALNRFDLHAMQAQFQANLQRAQVAGSVTAYRGLTSEVAQDWHIPAALLFVDAGHDYANVKDDLTRWCPFLMPGGLLIMHDVVDPKYQGVTRAAAELLRAGWRVVTSAGSAVAFRRD
jgi:predicted O-methyltransferase YrrM